MSDSPGIGLMLDIIILFVTSMGTLISLGTLALIFHYPQRYPINAAILLTCSTYVVITISGFTLLDMYAFDLYGHFHRDSSFNNWWCYARAYLLHVGICSIYHSYMLQTCFRFFRVIYHRYKHLQTVHFIFHLILMQWLIDFLLMLIILCLNHFHYTPDYYFCQMIFTDVRVLMIIGVIIYYLPMLPIVAMYYYIVRFINRTQSHAWHQNQYRANQRDVVVLRRILILVTLLLALCLPTILLWIV
jgi:hypothetical protein